MIDPVLFGIALPFAIAVAVAVQAGLRRPISPAADFACAQALQPLLYPLVPPGRVIVQGGAGRAGAVFLCGSGAVWLLWLLSGVYVGDVALGRER